MNPARASAHTIPLNSTLFSTKLRSLHAVLVSISDPCHSAPFKDRFIKKKGVNFIMQSKIYETIARWDPLLLSGQARVRLLLAHIAFSDSQVARVPCVVTPPDFALCIMMPWGETFGYVAIDEGPVGQPARA